MVLLLTHTVTNLGKCSSATGTVESNIQTLQGVKRWRVWDKFAKAWCPDAASATPNYKQVRTVNELHVGVRVGQSWGGGGQGPHIHTTPQTIKPSMFPPAEVSLPAIIK